MRNRVEELKIQLDRIFAIKESIRVYEEELDCMKDNVKREMRDMMLNEVASKYGKAYHMSYTRGTLNGDKTLKALQSAKHNEDVTLDDCKQYSDCDFIMCKSNPDSIIPTLNEFDGKYEL